MKNLALALALLLPLTACGAPFEAALFDGEAGSAGETIGLGAAGKPASTAGASAGGTSGSAGAGALSQGGGGAGGTDASGAAGAAGGPVLSQGGGGAGSLAGSGGAAGAAGASAGSGGVAPTPACDPATTVPGGAFHKDLGTISWCLRVAEDFDYLTCSGWDSRTIQVNGKDTPCWVEIPIPTKVDGYNYIQITAGKSDMATLAWSLL